jgi:phage gp36-like protein
MAYCTLADLKAHMPEEEILQITDQHDTDEIDEEKIDEYIRRADSTIDGYLRGRFSLPLTTVPGDIRNISIELAIYYMYKSQLALTLPEAAKKNFSDSMSMLKDIQSGRFSPFEVQQNPTWLVNNKAGQTMITTAQTNNWQWY